MAKRVPKSSINDKKLAVALSAILAFSVIGLSSTLSYLTDSEQHTNTFTAGDVKVDLTETNWDPSSAESVVPMQTVLKNPNVINTGVNESVVFLKITVPVKAYRPILPNGSMGTSTRGELFYMQKASTAVGVEANDFNTSAGGWVELPGAETGTDHLGNTRTYVFGYATALPGGNISSSATGTLFDKIVAVNLSEEDVSSDPENIIVEAYAIQANNVLNSAQTAYIDTSGTISQSDLTVMFNRFVSQNSGKTVKEADTGNLLNLEGEER